MWSGITRFIIRYRFWLLLTVLAVTVFMGYNARDLKLSYELIQVVPQDDPDFENYKQFKTNFGDDGNIMVVGIASDKIFTKKFFSGWQNLANDLKKVEGIKSVYSISDVQILDKIEAEKRFENRNLFVEITSQKHLDSLWSEYGKQPFYEGVIFNDTSKATYLAVTIKTEVLQSKRRDKTIQDVKELCEAFSTIYSESIHYSGMPYIRYIVANMVQTELRFFSLMSLVVCALFLLLFFRSFSSVVFPMVVILIIVTWSLGTIGLMDLRINVILSLVPPLIIIIGVPNFIYLVNKYHAEFKKHGNKIKAIHRMVEKIGVVTLMTNLTTAIGFLVLAFTNSPVLKEFGLVAGINIIATFIVSIIIIPVVFSYMPEPSTRHINYLNHGAINAVLARIEKWVLKRRKVVYTLTISIVLIAVYGITKLQAVGYILDDIEKENIVYKDLKFFERNFGGVLPFEVLLSSDDRKDFENLEIIKKINLFQDSLNKRAELSRSFSFVDLLKFSRQAYYRNAESRYDVPRNKRELNFVLQPYIANSTTDSMDLASNIVSESGHLVRITANMADVGSDKASALAADLKSYATELFGDEIDVKFTGLSLIYLKNNGYLIKSLIWSLVWAFVIISVLIGLLFRRPRMVIISLIPNFVPLIVTAGMMGFLDIPLKPSTVLVFSIAFGICIDDALHFLAKYRQELRHHNWEIKQVLVVALKETGRSMFYTSIVLFAGFSIFMLSEFGGTKWLGLLTSTNLLIAMITNLVLLPSLILSFYRKRDF